MGAADVVASGMSVVLRGHFNPPIFQPAWFALNGLISKEDAEGAQVEAIVPQAAAFQTSWLSCQVSPDRLQVRTDDEEEFDRLRDVVQGVLRLLSHQPVAIMGINRHFHVAIESPTRWHKLGDRLTPKEIWERALNLPGMRSLTVEGVRDDAYGGWVRILVRPSENVEPGIYLEHNDHYLLERVDWQPRSRDEFAKVQLERSERVEPSPEKIQTALEILESKWYETISHADLALHTIQEAL